jgi:nitrilase
MSDKVKVAALQMVSTADLKANLDTAEALIRRAAEQKARLAVLPENFTIISADETAKLRHREPFGSGPLQDFLAGNARYNGIWVMGGTIPLESDDPERVYNSCLLYDADGACVARYDKIHLFDVKVGGGNESYNESKTMVPGDQVVVAETPFGNIGMSICYDLRFPELYRRLSDQQAVILTVPSAFTETTGRKHWELLLRARAVENLCYIIAPNQGGEHAAGRRTWGHSMIIDPWGEVLGELDTGPGVVCAELDLGRQRDLRESFPALNHARLLH